MAVTCATCERFACRLGRLDAVPDDCPMRDDFPPFTSLYGPEDVRVFACESARVEAAGYGRWTRLREVVEFCRRMGYARVGLPHCPDMEREAALAAACFRNSGLEPVFPAPVPEPRACDPTGQARDLAARETDFNVICGMCVGHDALFIRASRAPVTSLVVRDVRLRHHPAGAIYTRSSYLKDALYRNLAPDDDAAFLGWGEETLARCAAGSREPADGHRCRLEETMDFARRLGARRLGIVFCSGLRKEARMLTGILESNGFRVSSACCKTGAVPKEELGIAEEEKVRPGEPEMICNPLAQAELLNREEVHLALLLGQCVGHDSATMARLDAPAICLVAKDRVLAHNSVAALYAV